MRSLAGIFPASERIEPSFYTASSIRVRPVNWLL